MLIVRYLLATPENINKHSRSSEVQQDYSEFPHMGPDEAPMMQGDITKTPQSINYL